MQKHGAAVAVAVPVAVAVEEYAPPAQHADAPHAQSARRQQPGEQHGPAVAVPVGKNVAVPVLVAVAEDVPVLVAVEVDVPVGTGKAAVCVAVAVDVAVGEELRGTPTTPHVTTAEPLPPPHPSESGTPVTHAPDAKGTAPKHAAHGAPGKACARPAASRPPAAPSGAGTPPSVESGGPSGRPGKGTMGERAPTHA